MTRRPQRPLARGAARVWRAGSGPPCPASVRRRSPPFADGGDGGRSQDAQGVGGVAFAPRQGVQHGLITVSFAGGSDEHVDRDGACGSGGRVGSAHAQRQIIEVNRQFDTARPEVAVEQHLLSGPVEDGHALIGRLPFQPLRQPPPCGPSLLGHDGGTGRGRFLAARAHADIECGVGRGRAHEPGVIPHGRHRFRAGHLTVEEPFDLQDAPRQVAARPPTVIPGSTDSFCQQCVTSSAARSRTACSAASRYAFRISVVVMPGMVPA